MNQLLLKKVKKTYSNGFKAIHEIDIEIKKGEFLVLIGPSGCGKSTLLRMIAGLESITSGEIWIENNLANDLSPKKRKIAMVFQNYALYPHMDVYNNLAFGLKLSKVSKNEIENKIIEVAKKLEITELLKRKPKQLSGGQRQRVALGRAIIRKPNIFLFDEPLSNLDATLRVSMRLKIIELHNQLKNEGENATMIYVTHDQTEAMTMADRICVLNHGKIVQIGTPLNLYHHPINKFVAGFFGTPAMNFIKGTLIQKENDIFFSIQNNKNLAFPKEKQEALKLYINKQVILGIRPENIGNIKTHPNGNPNNFLSGQVSIVENLGNEKIIHFKLNDISIISRIEIQKSTNLKYNDISNFYFNMDAVHIFDSETEKNLF